MHLQFFESDRDAEPSVKVRPTRSDSPKEVSFCMQEMISVLQKVYFDCNLFNIRSKIEDHVCFSVPYTALVGILTQCAALLQFRAGIDAVSLSADYDELRIFFLIGVDNGGTCLLAERDGKFISKMTVQANSVGITVALDRLRDTERVLVVIPGYESMREAVREVERISPALVREAVRDAFLSLGIPFPDAGSRADIDSN